MKIPRIRELAVLVSLIAPMLGRAQAAAPNLDVLVLGDPVSEHEHALRSDESDTVKGLLGEPARRLLPLAPVSWEGGRLVFTVKVDPEKQTYLSLRLSGDDVSDNRLFLFCEGKQIGYRHLGDIEQLDFGAVEPAYAGRFTYVTTPLPRGLTKDKRELALEIRSTGRIWGYGNTFEKYQKPLEAPTRGLYRLYTHVDGFVRPAADEAQGRPPAAVPLRSSPGEEVLDQIKDRVNRALRGILDGGGPPNQMKLQLIARAYDVEWTIAYHNPQVVERVLQSLDFHYAAFLKNPGLARADPATPNPDWFGLGLCGQAVMLRAKELAPFFDATIPGQTHPITRREALTAMMVETRDVHRFNRRLYTNQSMINDLNGIYYPNRALAVLRPDQALPEAEALRYLYESVGLQPWLGNDLRGGGSARSAGDDYLQLTEKGLTKELGYVGTYGEVIDLVCEIYEATRPAIDQPGDTRIRDQLVKIVLARSHFRLPALDADGNRVMRLEQIIGWRDSHHPGVVAYGQRGSRTGSALQAAAITLDPRLVGHAGQMLADRQFFQSELEAMKERTLLVTTGRLNTPDHYARILAQPENPHRLPMGWDQPDHVFSDEEDGVVAIKHGREILYASLYWRARHAVNFLGRVHFLTPGIERVAVVAERTEFTPSGLTYHRPNWTNFGFGNGGTHIPYPKLDSALAGEELPIAKIPQGLSFRPGEESIHAGKGDFYELRYGPYLIAMNLTRDRRFTITAPRDAGPGRELVSGHDVAPGAVVAVAPRSTVVIRLAP